MVRPLALLRGNPALKRLECLLFLPAFFSSSGATLSAAIRLKSAAPRRLHSVSMGRGGHRVFSPSSSSLRGLAVPQTLGPTLLLMSVAALLTISQLPLLISTNVSSP